MKHQDPLVEYLQALLDASGMSLDAQAAVALIAYLRAVLSKNRQVNLTSITDPRQAVRLHVFDSLLARPAVDAAPAGDGLDMGSGAGFPGVVLAVATQRRFDLLDSVSKKMRAVEECLPLLGAADPGIRTLDNRVEGLALERPYAFSAVTARALASLPSLVELAAPLLVPGGRLVCLKGRLDSGEREAGTSAASVVGLALDGVEHHRLPEGDEERTVLSFVRVDEPQIPLPRRVGMAQRRPLG